MTSELRNMIKVHSGNEACDDQKSLNELLTDLRKTAGELDLDFDRADLQARIRFESHDESPFCPCI
jgi:hypothetical protein